MKAKKLGEILITTYLKPLSGSDFDEYYIDCASPRGDDPLNKIRETLLVFKNSPKSMKILFSGHRGCGKSTELEKLCRSLDNEFFIVKFSVLKELDINNITYVDLLFEMVRQLYKKAEDEEIPIKKEIIEDVFEWLNKLEVKIVRDKIKDLKATSEVGIKFDLVAKLMGLITGTIKNSVETREEIRKNIEPKISDLIIRCNLVITEVEKHLKRKVLIIVEDLDKLDMKTGRDVFCDHASQLTQLVSNIIYTFPIALAYSSHAASFSSYFDFPYVLPMIKLRDVDGVMCESGLKAMKDIVEKRLDLSLFEANVLDRLIAISGGSIRDLFRLIQEATLNSSIAKKEKIGEQAQKKAADILRSDYKRRLTERRDKEIVIKVEEYYEALEDVEKNKTSPNQNQAFMDLLHNMHILMYNGKCWYDIHPLTKGILDDRKRSLEKQP